MWSGSEEVLERGMAGIYVISYSGNYNGGESYSQTNALKC